MTDWADDRANYILGLFKIADEAEMVELLAAALRGAEAEGAHRGVNQLAEGLQAKFGSKTL